MRGMYYAPLNISANAGDIDLIEILTTTEKPIAIHEIVIGQVSETGDAAEEFITLIIRRVTGAPTSGSGGGTSSPIPTHPNDAATSVTVETGNTTPLSGGTSVELMREAWNLRSAFTFLPPPEGRIYVAGATRLVVELGAAPADSVGPYIGHILFEELV